MISGTSLSALPYVITSIVADRVSGKKLPHECGKSRLTAFEKDMRMIGHQRPGIDIRFCFQDNRPHSGYEYLAILIVGNDLSFLDPPDNP